VSARHLLGSHSSAVLFLVQYNTGPNLQAVGFLKGVSDLSTSSDTAYIPEKVTDLAQNHLGRAIGCVFWDNWRHHYVSQHTLDLFVRCLMAWRCEDGLKCPTLASFLRSAALFLFMAFVPVPVQGYGLPFSSSAQSARQFNRRTVMGPSY
jgi:hypothetical protein